MAHSRAKNKLATSRHTLVLSTSLKNLILEGFGGQVVYLPVGVFW
jgi:hypothetical protein